MNKKLLRILLLVAAAGFFISSLSRAFSGSLHDFFLGFFEGYSAVMIIAGAIYLWHCKTHNKKLFGFKEK